MHIALFTDSNIEYLDGVARIIQELINYISAHSEHKLTVFHRDSPTNSPPTERSAENVIVHGIKAPIIGIPGYDAYPFTYLKSPKRRILRLLQTSDSAPDVCLTVTPYIARGIGNSALYVSKQLGIPLVGSFDVPLSWYSEYYLKKLFGRTFLAKIFRSYIARLMNAYRACDMILVPSDSMDQYVRNLCGEIDTALFPRAVDCEAFNPSKRSDEFRSRHGLDGKVAIVFVGRLALEKNLSALCSAVTNIRSRNRDAILLMVGYGPERERIEREGVEGVVFTGALFGDDLYEAFASADVFAYPSVVDAGPMAILEAMASGLPAVVMRGGGTHEVVQDGETGFVADTAEQFEEVIEKLVADAELRSKLSAAARNHAVSRDWPRVWEQVLESLDAAIRKHA